MYSIGCVERDTGIGRDTLRVWERRYGFPNPQRNPKGERIYVEKDVQILLLIKRLLNIGYRPNKVVGLKTDELKHLINQSLAKEASKNDCNSSLQSQQTVILDIFINCLKRHEPDGLMDLFDQYLLQYGLKDFILNVAAPLVTEVGECWARSDIDVFEEHFFSRQLSQFIDLNLEKLPRCPPGPTILLASLPGEMHSLGLLMLEALLKEQGLNSVNLGTEVPIQQLQLATQHYQVKTILLSFSQNYKNTRLKTDLLDLCHGLDDQITVWVGGRGIKPMRNLPKQLVLKAELKDVFELKSLINR